MIDPLETEAFVRSLFTLLADIESPDFLAKLRELTGEEAPVQVAEDKDEFHSRKRQRSPSARTPSRSPKRERVDTEPYQIIESIDSGERHYGERKYKQKCKDFFEKGFCNASSCPYDHGRRAQSMNLSEFEKSHFAMV